MFRLTLMVGGQSTDCSFLTTPQLLPKATLPEICSADSAASQSVSPPGGQRVSQGVNQLVNQSGRLPFQGHQLPKKHELLSLHAATGPT
jgi:hypothetical protein